MTSLFLASKKNKGYGYDYDDKKRNTKLLGEQNLPTRIFFPTERDFLKFIEWINTQIHSVVLWK